MATQAIEQEMNIYFNQLNEAEKKSIVEMIKTFIDGKDAGAERINIEQYNEEIEEAMKRIDAGEFTTQENLEKEMKKW